eukprot:349655-Chlamydomonas_euryale.AAC.4
MPLRVQACQDGTEHAGLLGRHCPCQVTNSTNAQRGRPTRLQAPGSRLRRGSVECSLCGRPGRSERLPLPH